MQFTTTNSTEAAPSLNERPAAKKWLLGHGAIAMTVADQAAFSLWGLGITVLAGHLNDPATFGAFSIAFAALMFASGFDTAFVFEPMAILGRSRHNDDLRGYLSAQRRLFLLGSCLRVSAMLLTALAVFVFGSHPIGRGLAFAAIASTFLLLGWFARQAAFVLSKPSAALTGDVAALTLVGCATYEFHRRTEIGIGVPFVLLAAAGIALALVATFHCRAGYSSPRENSRLWPIAKEQLRYGRWQASFNVIYSVSTQMTLIITGSVLGLRAAGSFKAASLVASLFTYVATGLSLLITPSLAEHYGTGDIASIYRKARLTAVALAAGSLVYTGLLTFIGRTFLRTLFGRAYGDAAGLVPLLALSTSISMLVLAPSLFLRAVQWPIHYVLCGGPTAVVSVICTILLAHRFGLIGVGYGAVMTASFSAGLSWLLLHRRIAYLTRRGHVTAQPS
jgi:O-antigen/teichoic acid export membrane protein